MAAEQRSKESIVKQIIDEHFGGIKHDAYKPESYKYDVFSELRNRWYLPENLKNPFYIEKGQIMYHSEFFEFLSSSFAIDFFDFEVQIIDLNVLVSGSAKIDLSWCGQKSMESMHAVTVPFFKTYFDQVTKEPKTLPTENATSKACSKLKRFLIQDLTANGSLWIKYNELQAKKEKMRELAASPKLSNRVKHIALILDNKTVVAKLNQLDKQIRSQEISAENYKVLYIEIAKELAHEGLSIFQQFENFIEKQN